MPPKTVFKLTRPLPERIRACLKDFDEATARTLLEEAGAKLSDAESLSPEFEIASLRQVSVGSPSFWEGELADGDEFFIRYRRGKLCAFVDDKLIEIVEPDLPDRDTLTLRQARMLLGHIFRFPTEKHVALKPLRPVWSDPQRRTCGGPAR